MSDELWVMSDEWWKLSDQKNESKQPLTMQPMLLKIFPWQLINLISPGPSNFQRIFSIKVQWVHDALQIKHACYNLPIPERENY